MRNIKHENKTYLLKLQNVPILYKKVECVSSEITLQNLACPDFSPWLGHGASLAALLKRKVCFKQVKDTVYYV